MIYQDGTHQFATVYRVDDPGRPGWKMIVCGRCVDETQATDSLRTAGHHVCPQCGGKIGAETAYERADELLARICPVTARRRSQRSDRSAKGKPKHLKHP